MGGERDEMDAKEMTAGELDDCRLVSWVLWGPQQAAWRECLAHRHHLNLSEEGQADEKIVVTAQKATFEHFVKKEAQQRKQMTKPHQPLRLLYEKRQEGEARVCELTMWPQQQAQRALQ
eukprot:TRINITY_DN23396_c0_g1_i1.p3 TRINITY_DN23396_c0_g1~~TRINITY_DN23396_c0_g1_i1.p3  ORF type:complete len:119 (+),score=17.06 TRINITY_DN23396_c0_g1_i1:298-654(+)